MKKFIIFLIIAAAVAGIWMFLSPDKDIPPVSRDPGTGGKDRLEHKVMSFTIDGRSPHGVKKWSLTAESAEIKGEDIFLDSLSATAYSDRSKVDLVSDSGVYYREEGEVELMGNVEVVSDEGVTLRTQKARWSQNTEEIFTDAPVTIERGDMTASGTGGMASSRERKAALNKDVTVKIEPHTKVVCSGPLVVLYDENKAIFQDNVRVKDKDGELFSDKLTVEFDRDSRKIALVTAEGNVRVRKGKSYTVSDKAVYTDSTRSAKLSGHPRVIIDPQEIESFENPLKQKTE